MSKILRYRNQITAVKQQDQIHIHTDTGDQLRTFSRSKISQWWQEQDHSDLRRNQYDHSRMIFDAFNQISWHNEPVLYTVYRVGQDRLFRQAHDVFLAQIPHSQVWILMTYLHTWIQVSDLPVQFHQDQAQGSVQENSVSRFIFDLRNSLIKQQGVI